MSHRFRDTSTERYNVVLLLAAGLEVYNDYITALCRWSKHRHHSYAEPSLLQFA